MRATMLCLELDHLVSGHALAITTLREAPADISMLSTSTLSSELPLALLAIPTSTRARAKVPGSPKPRLQAETLPVSHRAISLVSCRGRHLDHVPQEGHPALLDQQRAVLVRCGGEGRQHVIRVGLLSACGPETLLL